jgi:hypothetical protein
MRKSILIVASASLLATIAHAQVPTGFTDNGDTTLQHNAGLEWLDITQTIGRSVNDVTADITDAPNQYYDVFKAHEGWRYATRAEFQALVSEWFGIQYTGFSYSQAPFGNTDSPLVEAFIKTFGDTQDYFLDYTGSNIDISADGAGATRGFLAPMPTSSWKSYTVVLGDMEAVKRGTNIQRFDSQDTVNDSGTTPNSHARLYWGSFLVRDIPLH